MAAKAAFKQKPANIPRLLTTGAPAAEGQPLSGAARRLLYVQWSVGVNRWPEGEEQGHPAHQLDGAG